MGQKQSAESQYPAPEDLKDAALGTSIPTLHYLSLNLYIITLTQRSTVGLSVPFLPSV